MTDNSIFHESKHIEWSIKNFFDEPDVADYKLESPCVSLFDAKWFLRIYTNGITEWSTSHGYICLSLRRNGSASEHNVFFRIAIKKKDGAEFKALQCEHIFPKTIDYGWGFPEFIKRAILLESKEDVAPNGTLTVCCTFRIMDRLISSPSIDSVSQTRYDGTSTLIKDLQDMYVRGFQSDLTITVKNKEFRAHRNILSTRSSVFKSMLSHDMMERSSGTVEILDGDPDTFEDFLLYLYTGKFDNVSSRNAVSLYLAADKYDVEELKDECVRCLADELSDNVFCDVLHLAFMQNEKDLLKTVTDYFINNAKTIVTTRKWHMFIEEHPVVANELFYKQLISKHNIEKNE